jgi:hypothetical protein
VTGAPLRADRLRERVYAGTVVLVAGSWSAAAVGFAGSRVLSAVVDLWGWRARLSLRPGQTVADVIAHVPAIESGLGTRPGAVRVEPDSAHAARVLMRVLTADPHAKSVPWPGVSVRSITQPVHPRRVRRRHAGAHLAAAPTRALGGIAGSGKSGVLNVIVAHLAACADVVLWVIDLKSGMELRPWASWLDRLATTPGESARLLRDAVAIVEARARAYLVTDEDVRQEAARRAPSRPALDELSAAALGTAHAAAEGDPGEVVDAEIVDDTDDPDEALWTALRTAPDTGVSVPELMTTTAMGRTWIYDRLQSHAAAGRAEQVARGRWRAAAPYRERPAA